jgi:hypothetical protein
VELVSELSVHSDEFRRLWARHDVNLSAPSVENFQHPLVGPLELRVARLAIVGSEGQRSMVHHADPGNPSERALNLFAGVAASEYQSGDARP